MSTKQLPLTSNFPSKSYCVKKLSYEIKSTRKLYGWIGLLYLQSYTLQIKARGKPNTNVFYGISFTLKPNKKLTTRIHYNNL
jgi:hypothetical protein